jgi:hypothetical protein
VIDHQSKRPRGYFVTFADDFGLERSPQTANRCCTARRVDQTPVPRDVLYGPGAAIAQPQVLRAPAA